MKENKELRKLVLNKIDRGKSTSKDSRWRDWIERPN